MQGSLMAGYKAINCKQDLCKFLQKRKSGDVITNYALSLLSQYGKLPSKCPIPAGIYEFSNISLNNFSQALPFKNHLMKNIEVHSLFTYFVKEGRKLKEILTVNSVILIN